MSNECTRKTLKAYNGKLITTLLSDKNYDYVVITQLSDLGPFELDNGGLEYVGVIDNLFQALMGEDDNLLVYLKCIMNFSKNPELKVMIKKHAKINKLYKKLTNMLKHEVFISN